MSTRTITHEAWYGWFVSEANLAGWQVQAPYGHRRNMSGCPDMTIARDHEVHFIFLRTVSDPAPTKAQRPWIASLPAGTAHVFTPTVEHADLARTLLA